MTGGTLTDVPGLQVGHATAAEAPTGCTAILCPTGAVGAVEIRGWASGVIGVDLLDPRHRMERIHAVVLAGGSAFGLEAAFGVMAHLERAGIGLATPGGVIPLVAAAILYDLSLTGGRVRPDRAMGERAAAAATTAPVTEGSVGAGAGATVGKAFGLDRAMKGGLGTASRRVGGATVGAVVAVNAVGDVRDPATGRLVAGARDAPDGRRLVDSAAAFRAGLTLTGFRATNTTIGVVATDARLTKPEASRLVSLAYLGLAATLSPAHTQMDGDTLFCLSTGEASASLDGLGLAAADCVADAVVRAVRTATRVGRIPAARDLPDNPPPPAPPHLLGEGG
jgi:L-aminopeptidase/D-esterase-like protein